MVSFLIMVFTTNCVFDTDNEPKQTQTSVNKHETRMDEHNWLQTSMNEGQMSKISSVNKDETRMDKHNQAWMKAKQAGTNEQQDKHKWRPNRHDQVAGTSVNSDWYR